MAASCFEARKAESGDGVSCGSGERCELPYSGVWGTAPAEIESGAFLALKSDIRWQQFR